MTTTQKLVHLLSKHQRRAAVALIGFLVIGMVLETLGVGLVIPALTLLSQRDVVAAYPALAPWLHRLGNPTHERLVVDGMLALIAVTLIKALFLGFLAWRQARFVFALQSNLSQRLFTGYLRQPYAFHLQRNSAQLIRNTISQVGEIAAVLQQGLILITELLVMIGVSALLIVVEPVGALLVVSILGVAGVAFNRITRKRILRWGEAHQRHEGLRIQHLQQGLGGSKDVKLLGREEDFLARYRVHTVGGARVSELSATLQAFPRLFLELLAMIGLATLVIIMVGRGRPVEALLPTLGLFAAAAFRLMPSMNRILGAYQSVRFTLPVIDTLHGELALIDGTPPTPPGKPLPLKRTLTLERISFRYPGAENFALRDVSLSIASGASVGFIGGSGAGKSTLVDLMLGLLAPESGAVKVDGVDIKGNPRGWQDQIGYVPQSIFLTDDSLRRNVAFGLADDQMDEAAVRKAIRSAQLEEFVSSLPEGLDTVVGERGVRLSGGQRQRIGIARSLYHDPAVLVLDEATSSLDTFTERGVMDAVRALKGGKTIIIVAHRMSTVEYCDRLFRIEGGRLVEEGESATVLAAAQNTK